MNLLGPQTSMKLHENPQQVELHDNQGIMTPARCLSNKITIDMSPTTADQPVDQLRNPSQPISMHIYKHFNLIGCFLLSDTEK